MCNEENTINNNDNNKEIEEKGNVINNKNELKEKEEDIKRKENKKMEIINKIDEIKTSNKILSPDDQETKKEFQAEKRIKKNYEKYGNSVKEKKIKKNK